MSNLWLSGLRTQDENSLGELLSTGTHTKEDSIPTEIKTLTHGTHKKATNYVTSPQSQVITKNSRPKKQNTGKLLKCIKKLPRTLFWPNNSSVFSSPREDLTMHVHSFLSSLQIMYGYANPCFILTGTQFTIKNTYTQNKC
jgi:hypothetical protein